MNPGLIDTLVTDSDRKIVFLIMDGIGGLPHPETGLTELESAATPNLDALARDGVCGLLDPVGYGVTPGSGPAHFALFGYDPVEHTVGRGLLSAAGIDFPMQEGDLFARINFATVDDNNTVIDRRAGRIDSETNRRLCEKLSNTVKLAGNISVSFETVREHRALLVLRGGSFREDIEDTDPGKTGKQPLPPRPLSPEAGETAAVIEDIIGQAQRALTGEQRANMILLRGFARYRAYRTMRERYRLNALAIANYPMYRGIARLLGMTVHSGTDSIPDEFTALGTCFEEYDFFFLHVKQTDSRGEDGNFAGKVQVIEEVDALIPSVTALNPDVLVVTGDHSTPAALSSHSWHPVPVLIHGATVRTDGVTRFGERDCIAGGIGRMPMVHLMGLTLAHAGRLKRFGA